MKIPSLWRVLTNFAVFVGLGYVLIPVQLTLASQDVVMEMQSRTDRPELYSVLLTSDFSSHLDTFTPSPKETILTHVCEYALETGQVFVHDLNIIPSSLPLVIPNFNPLFFEDSSELPTWWQRFNELIKDIITGEENPFSQEASGHVIPAIGQSEARELLGSKVREILEGKYQSNVGAVLDQIFSARYFGLGDIRFRSGILYTNEETDQCFSDSMINHILRTSQRIIDQSKKGDVLVSVGSSPYFVHHFLSNLVSKNEAKDSHRQLISIPLSGTPNSSKTGPGGKPEPEHIVTPQRHRYFRALMKNLGLTAENPLVAENTTYFIDIYGSGQGPCYLIHALLQDFQEKRPGVRPKMALFALNEIGVAGSEQGRNALIADGETRDGESCLFSFPTKKQTSFSMLCKVVYIPNHTKELVKPGQYRPTLGGLPSRLRPVPEYPAYKWGPDYRSELSSMPPEAQRLLRNFDTRVAKKMKETPNSSK